MDAATKFWESWELGEKLVSYLDPLSVLRLIESKMMDKETLQKSLSSKAWNSLIRRTSNGEGLMEEEDLRVLVKILHSLELEEPGPLLLPLLDLICALQVICGTHVQCRHHNVEIICPCHNTPHFTSDCAFILLEEVESTFGTTVQSLKSIVCSWPDTHNLFLAIISRMSRQKEIVNSIHMNGVLPEVFSIKDKSSIEDFTTLLKARVFYLPELEVTGSIGGEGWQALNRALEGKTEVLKLVNITLQALKDAKDSIEGIWDATEEEFRVVGGEKGYTYSWLDVDWLDVDKSKYDWEHAWMRLKQIRDMDGDEFKAEIRLEQMVELRRTLGETTDGEYSEDEEAEDEAHDEEEGGEEHADE